MSQARTYPIDPVKLPLRTDPEPGPFPGLTAAQTRALGDATQTYTDLVTALTERGIYMPELHIDLDERSSNPDPIMVLGWVSMGSARKLVNILRNQAGV
ncbi:hypothetical protein J7E91_22995 [Streptomyces sp. ISL-99]|uniref:hypothetical protein n=1 Tax=Streptomyces sp. ISL-99 TaxID=2819193 RepID=UPI001BEC5A62|nr:hypothetical protein [Streptomyces sp. ISL-99]MBT2528202.1 hypothetical protein [Streptomyces sp. ISL-99]